LSISSNINVPERLSDSFFARLVFPTPIGPSTTMN